MRNGKNVHGQEFEVLDEDGDAIAGFDTMSEAVKCARALPWYYGAPQIRRDEKIVRERHEREMKGKEEDRKWWAAFEWHAA